MQASPRAITKGGLFFLQGLGLLCAAGPSIADVDISGISGTLNHGNLVTISGAGFGQKNNAAPLLWDDFENGPLGDEIIGHNGWKQYAPDYWSGYGEPYYSGTRTYGTVSQQSAKKDMWGGGGDFHTAFWDGFTGSDKEAYASLYLWWDTTNGASLADVVWKLTRLNANKVYDGVPQVGNTYRPSSNWYYEYYGVHENTTYPQENATYKPTRKQWHRMEVYWRLDSRDGAVQTWVNLQPNMDNPSIQTEPSGANNTVKSILLPMMGANSEMEYTIYVDDVYVDNTRARVEIGDAPQWSDCTKRELQRPSDWSDTAIKININKGSFDDLQDAYLYVVDANGTVNEKGYPLMHAAAPKPPTDLKVR